MLFWYNPTTLQALGLLTFLNAFEGARVLEDNTQIWLYVNNIDNFVIIIKSGVRLDILSSDANHR